MSWTLSAKRGVGKSVSGFALVSNQPFSPRYDLNRATGVISRKGHPLEGQSIRDVILVCPTAKGGVAGGWAFVDLQDRNLAPAALLFDVANPVMVQGATAAGIPIMDTFERRLTEVLKTGDKVLVDPTNACIHIQRPS